MIIERFINSKLAMDGMYGPVVTFDEAAYRKNCALEVYRTRGSHNVHNFELSLAGSVKSIPVLKS